VSRAAPGAPAAWEQGLPEHGSWRHRACCAHRSGGIVLVVHSPWLVALCTALALLCAASFVLLAAGPGARRGALRHRVPAGAAAAWVGTTLWSLPLALYDGGPAAAPALQAAAPAWLAAVFAAALALPLGRSLRPGRRLAAVGLLLSGSVATVLPGAAGPWHEAGGLPGPGALAAAAVALLGALGPAVAAALLLPGQAPATGLRSAAAVGLLGAALLAVHAAVPWPTVPAVAGGVTAWTFPAGAGLEAALLMGLLTVLAALAARRAGPAGPAQGRPAQGLRQPAADHIAAPARMRLQQLAQDLRGCQQDSDAWQLASQAGAELFQGWDGALALATRPWGEALVAGWGRLEALHCASTQPLLPDRRVRAGRPGLPDRSLTLAAGATPAPAPGRPVIRTQIAWAPQRLGTLHLVGRKPVGRSTLRDTYYAAEALAQVLQHALADLHARRQVRQPWTGDGAGGLFQHPVLEHALRHGCARADRTGCSLVLALVEVRPIDARVTRVIPPRRAAPGEAQALPGAGGAQVGPAPPFGPPAGELLLRDVACRVRDLVRPGDIVCRIGAARLAVLVGQAPLPAVRRRLEMLRADAATLSVGVAQHERDARRGLLHRAEVALQAARRSGSGRVVCWDAWSEPQSYVVGLDRAGR
jgi:hypothetical protein